MKERIIFFSVAFALVILLFWLCHLYERARDNHDRELIREAVAQALQDVLREGQ